MAVLTKELKEMDAWLAAVDRGILDHVLFIKGGYARAKAISSEVDPRILDLLTQGEYERARAMLEEQTKAWVAGLSPPPPPPPPST